MELLGLIKERRSIRRFAEREVEGELIERIIEAGIWAPSSNHCEPCEFIVVRDKNRRKELAKISPWSGFLAEAPVAICIIADRSSSCVIQDGSIAAMNMLLQIHALGLGSCWVDVQYNEELVRRILKIPDNYEVITVIPVGWPRESPSSTRKSLADCIHHERYGA